MEIYDKLWALLIDRKVIKRRHLAKAAANCNKTGVPLDVELVEKYNIPRDDLLMYLRAVSPVDTIDLMTQMARPELAQLIPEDFSRRFSLLVAAEENGRLLVAMADPTDSFALEHVRVRADREVEARVPLLGDLNRATDEAYAVPVPVARPRKVELPPEIQFPGTGTEYAAKEVHKVSAITLDEAPVYQTPSTPDAMAAAVLKAGLSLQQEIEPRALVRKLLNQATYLVDAEAAGLVLREGRSWHLQVKHLQKEQIEKTPIQLEANPVLKLAWEQKLPQKLNEFIQPIEFPGIELRNLLCTPILWQGEVVAGLLTFNKRQTIFSESDLGCLEALSTQAGVALNQAISVNALRRTSSGVTNLMVEMLEGAGAVDFGHSSQVASLSIELGRALGLSPAELARLQGAALLHDLGKLKTFGPRIELHPEVGARMLAKVPILAELREIVRSHHEHYDGSGYPDRLEGEQIPPLARILCLAETWLEEGGDCPRDFWVQSSGKFDPRLEGAFFACVEEKSPL